VKPSKTPCTNRLINGKVARVVYGLADNGQFVPFTRGTVDDRMFR
jgi:pyrimidine deaminase RibD-like protein